MKTAIGSSQEIYFEMLVENTGNQMKSYAAKLSDLRALPGVRQGVSVPASRRSPVQFRPCLSGTVWVRPGESESVWFRPGLSRFVRGSLASGLPSFRVFRRPRVQASGTVCGSSGFVRVRPDSTSRPTLKFEQNNVCKI